MIPVYDHGSSCGNQSLREVLDRLPTILELGS